MVDKAHELSRTTLAQRAGDVDRARVFPRQNFDDLAASGLLGLMVPEAQGGAGGNLSTFAAICQELGYGCSSTAMCYLMHGCTTAVLNAGARDGHAERYLHPIAKGAMIGTLAFSERGTGAHFYNPEITAQQHNGGYVVNGTKSFVTSGGAADVYLILTRSGAGEGLDVLALDKETPGVAFTGTWTGIGMAGNQSVRLELRDVAIPRENLVGEEGKGGDLVFGVVAPTFLVGVAAVNVGIAYAATDAAVAHAKERTYPPDGKSLATLQAIQFYLAEMKIAADGAAEMVRRAAALADAGSPDALIAVMEAKIAATDAVIAVTNKAMQICGGQGYTTQLPIERYLRDGRASSVMAPTTEVLKEWIGKLMCDLPLF